MRKAISKIDRWLSPFAILLQRSFWKDCSWQFFSISRTRGHGGQSLQPITLLQKQLTGNSTCPNQREILFPLHESIGNKKITSASLFCTRVLLFVDPCPCSNFKLISCANTEITSRSVFHSVSNKSVVYGRGRVVRKNNRDENHETKQKNTYKIIAL